MVRNNMSCPTGRLVLLGVAAALAIVACGGDSNSSSGPPVTLSDPPVVTAAAAWLGFGSNPQHTAMAQVATQELSRIAWSTPVDVAPQYVAKGYLTVHYGSPAITS